MIGVSSDSYESYMNFIKGYWFDNKVVDCSSMVSIECNKAYNSSIEEINNEYKSHKNTYNSRNKRIYNKQKDDKKE